MEIKVFLKAYLKENLGDDLFIRIIAERYPLVDFYIAASDKYGQVQPYNVWQGMTYFDVAWLKLLGFIDKAFGTSLNKGWFAKIEDRISRKCDLNVYAIGSGFIEKTKKTDTQLKYEKKFYDRAPVLLGCNFGPFSSENYLERYRKLFSNTADLCFRDEYSANLFNELSHVRKEADLVFSYDLECDKIVPDTFGTYVVISVVSLKKCGDELSGRESEYVNYLRDCMDYILKQGKGVVVVGFCKKEHDDEIVEQLMQGQDEKLVRSCQYPDTDYSGMMGIFAHADAVIACRYHAMIIGFLYGKPVYVFAYSEKTVNVLHDIDGNARALKIGDMADVSPETFMNEYSCELSEERLSELKTSANRQFLYLDTVLRESEERSVNEES